MKRFLNTYTADVVTLGLEQSFPDPDSLALWTILRLRWPALAEYLGDHPEMVDRLGDEQQIPADLDPDLRTILKLPALQQLIDFEHGGPLTTELVQRLTGTG